MFCYNDLIDPRWNRGVGRQLMKSVLEYAQDKKCVMLQQVSKPSRRDGVRVAEYLADDDGWWTNQITADTGSFCLYASLGFVPVETCLHFQGRVREDIPLPTGNQFGPNFMLFLSKW